MSAYYNEIDPYAAQWLRNLIQAGHIAPGDVDERSIVDVRADELRDYNQCHFFAGIGGWSLALRLADWPDDRPVWTGSCPCQPFSAAGAGKAADDERHLWPAWLPLIAECRPPIVFGEQVEAAIGWGWFDAVFADMEAEGYACGLAVLPACGVGAPHIRQRCWFVADADGGNASAEGLQRGGEQRQQPEDGRFLPLANSKHRPRRKLGELGATEGDGVREVSRKGIGLGFSGIGGTAGELGDAGRARLQERERDGQVQRKALESLAGQTAIGRSNAWDCDWLPCTDGKARPVEPGTFPLAHGIPKRVGRLRAYGNAIVPQVAAEFIMSAADTIALSPPKQS